MCQNISCRHLLTVTLEKPLTKCLTQVFNSTHRSNSLLNARLKTFWGNRTLVRARTLLFLNKIYFILKIALNVTFNGTHASSQRGNLPCHRPKANQTISPFDFWILEFSKFTQRVCARATRQTP